MTRERRLPSFNALCGSRFHDEEPIVNRRAIGQRFTALSITPRHHGHAADSARAPCPRPARNSATRRACRRRGRRPSARSAPATMSPLRKVGSFSILTGARPNWSLPLQVQPATDLVAIAEGVRQLRIGLAVLGRGMIDVAAIDHLGLAGRAETVARRRAALAVGAADREIAAVAGAHAIGLRRRHSDCRGAALGAKSSSLAMPSGIRDGRRAGERPKAAEQRREEILAPARPARARRGTHRTAA